jgi:hypothetical protein
MDKRQVGDRQGNEKGMRMKRVCALGFCLATALGQFTAAADVYVNNLTGDDRATGEQQQNAAGLFGPVRTIAKATRLANSGDRIVLAASDQPYRESISLVGIKHSSSPLAPLTIAGNGATLDGSSVVPAAAWEHFSGDVFRFRPQRLAYQQLFLHGRPALRRPTTSFDGVPPALEPLEWSLTGGYIYFRIEAGRTPDAYDPACAALQTGISLYHVEGVEISDLTVQGFQLDGVSAFDTARDVKLTRVTVRGNGRSGVAVGGASRVEIVDSLLGDNGTSQLRTEAYSHTRVNGCELIDNTAPALLVRGGQLWVDGKKAASSQP